LKTEGGSLAARHNGDCGWYPAGAFARVGPVVIAVLCGVLAGCNEPSYVCHVKGTVTLGDGKYVSPGGSGPTPYTVPGERCVVELHMDVASRETAAAIVLAEGPDFDFPVKMGVFQPKSRWRAVFRCDGYQPTATPEFALGEGLLACRPVVLKSVQLERQAVNKDGASDAGPASR
jgi:hypothetical protein